MTLVEVIVIVLVLVLVAVLILPLLRRARDYHVELKEASQLRGIHQSMVQWATQNADDYPLPSAIDVDNTTVRESGAQKNTSANIFSILIFNGSIPPELLFSPRELHDAIDIDEDYEMDAPTAAVNPERALWDPAFDADFTDGTSNLSFAHLPLDDTRRERWQDRYNERDILMSTRGPEIATARTAGYDSTHPIVANPASLALQQGRSDDDLEWSPNVVFGDNHIRYIPKRLHRSGFGAKLEEVTIDDVFPTLKRNEFFEVPDLLTHNEPGHPGNTFLGIFTTAGEKPRDFTAIWD